LVGQTKEMGCRSGGPSGTRRESIAAKLTANIITEAGASRVLAMDLHSGQCVGYFDIPVGLLLHQDHAGLPGPSWVGAAGR